MKVRNFILGLGIFVVYALALFQGIEAFFPEPKYEDYCNLTGPRAIPFKEPNECFYNKSLDERAQSCYSIRGEFVYEYDGFGCLVDGYCDECRIEYETDLDGYSNKVFIISIIVGVFVLVIGFVFLKKEPVGSALIAGAIWSVFFGVVKNWRNFSNSWRFLLLFVLLIILIWLTLKFNETKKNKGWKFKIGFWKK